MGMNYDAQADDEQLIVLKFGGTSVATAERWQTIHSILDEHLRHGRQPVLVCSALSGVTNKLEGVAGALAGGGSVTSELHEIREQHRELCGNLEIPFEATLGERLRELDEIVAEAREHGFGPALHARLLSCGERMSTTIGAAWLNAIGVKTNWVDARDWLEALPRDEETDEATWHLASSCPNTTRPELRRALLRGSQDVTITQGFIAAGPEGETVLLGRGGSDASAAWIAALLDADKLEIWTDVPGLFTTNPRAVSEARLLTRATCQEAATLAALGGKVLHPRTLGPIEATGIPLQIRWTARPDIEGTIIQTEFDKHDDEPGFRAVSSRDSVRLIAARRPPSWQPIGFMQEVASCFSRHGLSMDMISSSPSEIRVTVDTAAFPGFDEQVDALMEELNTFCEAEQIDGVACVSLVGSQISTRIAQLSDTLGHLMGSQVHMLVFGADDAHASYIVDQEIADALVERAHRSLFEDRECSEVFGPTWTRLEEPAPSPQKRSVGRKKAGNNAQVAISA